MNYYNEFDKNAAAWLRELIKLGVIPDGEVDERSIEDVRAEDLKGFVQCHFFAGIAGWPEALRRAGVPATRPLWTGSCPCQDFSCAGKQEGFEGKRDLWPAFHNLIRQRRPELVFGEQVKNAVRHGWLDRLYADLEGEGYACGSVILGAHSAGADHQRQRIYWMADSSKRGGGTLGKAGEHGSHRANGAGGGGIPDRLSDAQHAERRPERNEHTEPRGRYGLGGSGESGGLEDPSCLGRRRRCDGDATGLRRALQTAGSGGVNGLADSETGGLGADGSAQRETGHASQRDSVGWLGSPSQPGLQGHSGDVADGGEPGRLGTLAAGPASETGFARNFWSDAIPHLCKDGKYRRFEPGIFPLVAKLPRGVVPSGDPRLPGYANATSEARVMRLKGYGNAICVDTAVLFIETCEEILK